MFLRPSRLDVGEVVHHRRISFGAWAVVTDATEFSDIRAMETKEELLGLSLQASMRCQVGLAPVRGC